MPPQEPREQILRASNPIGLSEESKRQKSFPLQAQHSPASAGLRREKRTRPSTDAYAKWRTKRQKQTRTRWPPRTNQQGTARLPPGKPAQSGTVARTVHMEASEAENLTRPKSGLQGQKTHKAENWHAAQDAASSRKGHEAENRVGVTFISFSSVFDTQKSSSR